MPLFQFCRNNALQVFSFVLCLYFEFYYLLKMMTMAGLDLTLWSPEFNPNWKNHEPMDIRLNSPNLLAFHTTCNFPIPAGKILQTELCSVAIIILCR